MLAFYEQIMYNVITTKQNIIKKQGGITLC